MGMTNEIKNCQANSLLKELYTQRVHVPNIWVLGFWVIVIMVQVLGKSMIIENLDP